MCSYCSTRDEEENEPRERRPLGLCKPVDAFAALVRCGARFS